MLFLFKLNEIPPSRFVCLLGTRVLGAHRESARLLRCCVTLGEVRWAFSKRKKWSSCILTWRGWSTISLPWRNTQTFPQRFLITMVMMKEKIVFTSSFSFFSYNKPENEPGTRKKTLTRLEMWKEKKTTTWRKKNIQKQVFFRESNRTGSSWGWGRGQRSARMGHSVSMVNKQKRFSRDSWMCFGAVLCFIDFRVETNFRALGREI